MQTFSDQDSPRHRLRFEELPRGFVAFPKHIVDGIARWQEQWGYGEDYARDSLERHTLAWYYEGLPVAYRPARGGIEVRSLGFEEVAAYQRQPRARRQGGTAWMSQLQTPLRHHILWSTGDLILRAYLDLLLKDDLGNWRPQTFRVDSASDLTTVPAYNARQFGLPLPQRPSPITHAQTGLEVRSGFIRCRVVGMDPIEHAFPCFFLGDPYTPPDPNTVPARLTHFLLGLSGVVNKVRWTFDGVPAGPHAPHGYLIVENVGRASPVAA